MQAYRLNRFKYPSYDGEGSRRVGGRWNSKGTHVIYMSENRSLCVLEVLVHLTDVFPDRYVLGQAEISDTLRLEAIDEINLPSDWKTLKVSEQAFTRRLGDEWIARRNSAVLVVPSVVVGERNMLINPGHPDFGLIRFHDPVPFVFDIRLFRHAVTTQHPI
jgi:RES domain-containing protein